MTSRSRLEAKLPGLGPPFRSGLETNPQWRGSFPADDWKQLRSRLDRFSAVCWQWLRSGLEIFPQWAGKMCLVSRLY